MSSAANGSVRSELDPARGPAPSPQQVVNPGPNRGLSCGPNLGPNRVPASQLLAQPPSTKQLFLGFLGLGLTAFGGALPLARTLVVDRRRWLSSTDFTDLLGLCQFLPGGNAINLSVAVGLKFQGIRGALAALGGLLAMPTLIVIALGEVYSRYSADPHVRHLFAGLAAAAAGLLVAMAFKLAWPLRTQFTQAGIAVACVVAIAWLRWPLLPSMAGLTALGLWLNRGAGQ